MALVKSASNWWMRDWRSWFSVSLWPLTLIPRSSRNNWSFSWMSSNLKLEKKAVNFHAASSERTCLCLILRVWGRSDSPLTPIASAGDWLVWTLHRTAPACARCLLSVSLDWCAAAKMNIHNWWRQRGKYRTSHESSVCEPVFNFSSDDRGEDSCKPLFEQLRSFAKLCGNET